MIAFLIGCNVTVLLAVFYYMAQYYAQKESIKSQKEYIVFLNNVVNSMQDLCDINDRMIVLYDSIIETYIKMNSINEEEINRLNGVIENEF